MFRRLANRLPQDPVFPADLEKLGYFVNDKDVIRRTANPEQKYQYKINRSERINDLYKEAMNTCTRRIALQRLLELGLKEVRLPLGTSQMDPHVPILVSPDLATKKHIILFFPERHIDLGILSYRVIGEEGINVGSIVEFVKTVLHGPHPPSEDNTSGTTSTHQLSLAERPGIIVANPSQLLWYRGGNRAVTDREWDSLPRESAVHQPMRIDEIKNRVSGNQNFREHIFHIFENVLSSDEGITPLCNPNAKVSIIGQEFVGSEALQYLANNWVGWRSRLNCIALINPQHVLEDLYKDFDLSTPGDVAEKEQITDFIVRRTRAYRLSQRPLEAVLSGRTNLGCNIYSAGETLYEESCFIRCWRSVLDWVEMCRFSETFAEPIFETDISEDENSKPKIRSPRNRKPQTEEQQLAARFRGELNVTEDGFVAKEG